MSLQRSDISSPLISGAVGAAVGLFFFPPGTGLLSSMLGGILGSAVALGIVECLASAIFAPKLIQKALLITAIGLLFAGAYFAVQKYSPVVNQEFVYTLF